MVTHIIAHILYWKGVWKRIRGGHISAKYLLRLVKKGVISHSLSNCDLLEEQVLAHICHAYKKYIRIKNNKRKLQSLASQIDCDASHRKQ